MPDDGLPLSQVALIDHEIRERVGRVMTGAPAADDLEQIAVLNRRRVEMTEPTLYKEAEEIFARIAALG